MLYSGADPQVWQGPLSGPFPLPDICLEITMSASLVLWGKKIKFYQSTRNVYFPKRFGKNK